MSGPGNYDSKRYTHPSVHNNTTLNSQDMETTKTFINRGKDKAAWRVFTVEYYSAIKKSKTMPFAAWMDLEIIISELSQTKTSII